MKLSEMLSSLYQNTVECTFSKETRLWKGASKFGGKPDLPADFTWFYYKGKDFHDVTKNRPLAFLLQIDCEELHPLDVDGCLPDKGILYFFYEMETQTWGFDPADAGSARVYYYDGPKEALASTDFPADLAPDYQFPELRIRFTSRLDLPSCEEFLSDCPGGVLTETELDDYEVERQAALNMADLPDAVTKLLGFADVIQNEMREECERVTNGVYCGGRVALPEEDRVRFAKDSKRWRLLLQLDTVESDRDDFELMFGDCGRLYFYIREPDLKARAFDKVWMISQCY